MDSVRTEGWDSDLEEDIMLIIRETVECDN